MYFVFLRVNTLVKLLFNILAFSVSSHVNSPLLFSMSHNLDFAFNFVQCISRKPLDCTLCCSLDHVQNQHISSLSSLLVNFSLVWVSCSQSSLQFCVAFPSHVLFSAWP